VYNLVVNSRNAGIEADVLHASPVFKSISRTHLDATIVWRCPLGPSRLVGYVHALRALSRDYDLLHVHDPQLMALSANVFTLARRPARLLSTHGGFFHSERYAQFKSFYWQFVAPRVLRQYDLVLASSWHDHQRFAAISDRVRLVQNGVDTRPFLSVQRSASPDFSQWIYWGRLSRNKRLDRAIHLVRQVRDAGYPIKLTVVGRDFDGTGSELAVKVRELDLSSVVTIFGPVSQEQLLALLPAFGVYVSASEHEGFGLSVVEAMAAGLVIICRDVSPLNGFVREGGNGVLLRFNDDRADLDKVLALVGSDAQSALRASRHSRAESMRYDWSTAFDAFRSAYDEALRRHRSARY
jgi:alpha-1,3-mannosyltransferase